MNHPPLVLDYSTYEKAYTIPIAIYLYPNGSIPLPERVYTFVRMDLYLYQNASIPLAPGRPCFTGFSAGLNKVLNKVYKQANKQRRVSGLVKNKTKAISKLDTAFIDVD